LGILSAVRQRVSILLHLRSQVGSGRGGSKRLGEAALVEGKVAPSKGNVIDNYDREGKNYDAIRYGRTKGGRFFSEIELGETLLMMKRGNVLHVGTATGRVSSHLISKGFDYVGLELSQVMARITKEKLDGSAHI